MKSATNPSTTPPSPAAGDQPANANWSDKLAAWIQSIRTGYDAVRPCRLVLIVALLVPAIFIWVEQAAEVLRCLAEGPAHTGGVRLGRVLWVVIGLTCVSLAGWWFSLVVLYFKFPDTPEETARRANQFMKWLPPVIGVIPSFGLGLAFVLAAAPPGEPLPARVVMYLRGFGGACFALGLVFLAWFRWRQNNGRFHTQSSLRGLWRSGDRAVVYTLIGAACLSLLLFVTLCLWPVAAAQALGATTLILLAAASWMAYGSVAIYLGHRWRLPLIRFLFLAAIVSSCWNNNHDIRHLAVSAPRTVPSFEEQYRSWYSDLRARYPQEPNPPVIVVATAGGGIRAAVWTATVLGALQDSNRAFADHVFAISGVSGGSLGAAVFGGLVKDGAAGSHRRRAQRILANDFLSPALAYMLFPDLLQQMVPMRLGIFEDRAAALEMAWQSAWKRTTKNDQFNEDFLALWDGEAGRRVPSLFLNGTSVESGQRMVVSNVRLDASFVMAEDICSRMTDPQTGRLTNTLRLSTAVGMSTRFCFVSPSGRFKDLRHVVDGGYFENSGAATVLDILDALEFADLERTNPPVKIVLVISNDPYEDQLVAPKSEFLSEALTPFHSLISTRQARGTYSETLLRMRAERTNFFRFALSGCAEATNDVPLPLGWALSWRAIGEMNQRLKKQEEVSNALLGRLPRAAPN